MVSAARAAAYRDQSPPALLAQRTAVPGVRWSRSASTAAGSSAARWMSAARRPGAGVDAELAEPVAEAGSGQRAAGLAAGEQPGGAQLWAATHASSCSSRHDHGQPWANSTNWRTTRSRPTIVEAAKRRASCWRRHPPSSSSSSAAASLRRPRIHQRQPHRAHRSLAHANLRLASVVRGHIEASNATELEGASLHLSQHEPTNRPLTCGHTTAEFPTTPTTRNAKRS